MKSFFAYVRRNKNHFSQRYFQEDDFNKLWLIMCDKIFATLVVAVITYRILMWVRVVRSVYGVKKLLSWVWKLGLNFPFHLYKAINMQPNKIYGVLKILEQQ